MLKKLQKLPDEQALVAYTGVQFLDYGFRLPEDFTFSRTFVELLGKTEESDEEAYELRQVETSRNGPGFIDSETKEPVASKATYTVQFARGLDTFDATWLPVPFLKTKGPDSQGRDTFESGPTNWVRMRIVRLSEAERAAGDETHRLTFAFDTRPGGLKWAYTCPIAADIENESGFRLATELRDIAWFLKEDWITGWLKDETKRADGEARPRPVRRADGVDAECLYWALYATLLGGLRVLVNGRTSNASLPKVRFINTLGKGTTRLPIDVDLILDIGNSRTCGVLIETGGDEELDLKDASILELRDLSRPERSYQEPFRSHVEFAQAEFGSTFWSKAGGGQGNFKWPSLVRVGPEALRLYDKSSGAEGDTGLSGPKRYIWDERENRQPWRFNVSESRHHEPMPVFGDLMLLLTREGELLKTAGPQASAAMEPKFSRAALFTFTVMELVLQAIVQINAADYRATKHHPNVHRRLRRILFTIPTATPLVEMRKYKARCEAAVSLLWDAYGWSAGTEGMSKVPAVVIAYDEATCTQIVYLYNEIVRKLQRTPADFFRSLNRNPLRPDTNSLRIASLDIGGGTTDLMIVNYFVEPPGNALNPSQVFREGFRKAGDDILEAVIAQHVLKAIEASLVAHRVPNAGQFLRAFMADAGKQEVQRHLRKLFVSRILVPIGLHLLSQYETADMFGEVRDHVSFASILRENADVLRRVIDFFEEPIRASGGAGFSLLDVEIGLDFEGLGGTITSVMGSIMSLMCEVVGKFDCDVLLLTGRPSRLPIIRDLILRYLPIAPHRLIFMHEYKVGSWYPFAGGFDKNDARKMADTDRFGKIDDPKTTVVVGALICELAETLEIRDFSLRRGGFSARSTARYIGRLLGEDTIRKGDIIFSQDSKSVATESKTLTVESPIFLGFRQLDLERWPGTPLFFLDFAEDGDGVTSHALTMPWTVRFRRNEPAAAANPSDQDADLESFWVDGIVDRNGNDLSPTLVRLRLQTMRNVAGYWLDTGTVTLD